MRLQPAAAAVIGCTSLLNFILLLSYPRLLVSSLLSQPLPAQSSAAPPLPCWSVFQPGKWRGSREIHDIGISRYLILRGVMDEAWLRAANAAVDASEDKITVGGRCPSPVASFSAHRRH